MRKEELREKDKNVHVGTGLVSAQNNENINTGINTILPKNSNKINVGVAWHATRKGITLISLIITIIILLILAGVALNLIIGENGIFKLAGNASKNYMNAQEKELSDLEKLYSQIKVATNDGSQITVSIEDLKNIIKEEIQRNGGTSNPTGTVISYITGTTPPTGYLACDGSTYNISDYPVLAESIKSGFGTYNYYGGDGETTFAVPNLQGEFLRGYSKNGASSVTNGVTTANIGQHQNATRIPYFSLGNNLDLRKFSFSPSNYDVTYDMGNSMVGISSNYDWTKEFNVPASYLIRPTNTAVLYCIKY